MRYVSTLDHTKMIEWKLNTNEAVLFAWLYELPSWAEKIIIGNEPFYFASRNKVIVELPFLTDKPDTVYRHYKALESKGLIILIKAENKDYITLTAKGKEWLEKPKQNHSEINPTDGNKSEKPKKNPPKPGNKSEESEINPNKLGNKSENSSEINPTNNNTYSNTDNNTYSDKAEEKQPASSELNFSEQPQPDTKPSVTPYQAFLDWTAENAPRVLKMAEPITEKQHAKLMADFKDRRPLMKDVLTAMHNFKDLHKDYISANLTLRQWMKRRIETPIVPVNKLSGDPEHTKIVVR